MKIIHFIFWRKKKEHNQIFIFFLHSRFMDFKSFWSNIQIKIYLQSNKHMYTNEKYHNKGITKGYQKKKKNWITRVPNEESSYKTQSRVRNPKPTKKTSKPSFGSLKVYLAIRHVPKSKIRTIIFFLKPKHQQHQQQYNHLLSKNQQHQLSHT